MPPITFVGRTRRGRFLFRGEKKWAPHETFSWTRHSRVAWTLDQVKLAGSGTAIVRQSMGVPPQVGILLN